MAYKTFTSKQDVVAVDIQTMADMSMEDYKEYIRTGLVTVDHHDVLRQNRLVIRLQPPRRSSMPCLHI